MKAGEVGRVLVVLLGSLAALVRAGEVHDSSALIGAPGSDEAGTPDAAWRMFRGGAALTGVAAGRLPEKLTVRWKFEALDAITSSAAIADDTVYVGGFDEMLYALGLTDGRLKWKYHAKGPVQSSPLVAGSLVVFGDDEGVIHALDRRTGEVRWTYATEGQVISSPNHHAGKVVVGSYDACLYCLDLESGTLLWKYSTEGYVHGTPAIAQDHVFAVGCDEQLHVVRVADGKARATVKIGSPSGASAAVRGPRAFVGTYGGRVLGIDWAAGRIAWAFEDPDRDFPFMGSAAATAEAVIIGGRDKRVRALDPATGKVRWTFVTRARVDSSPVVVDQRVFVGSSDGNLYALDRNSGRELWRFEAGAPITASPAVAAGCLVIGTDDGVLYCFGAAPAARP